MKEAYCNTCERFTPLLEEPLHKDDLNPYPWGDLCFSIHTAVRLNTDTPPSPRQSLGVQLVRDGNQWMALVGERTFKRVSRALAIQ
jgi:hypothetical protein